LLILLVCLQVSRRYSEFVKLHRLLLASHPAQCATLHTCVNHKDLTSSSTCTSCHSRPSAACLVLSTPFILCCFSPFFPLHPAFNDRKTSVGNLEPAFLQKRSMELQAYIDQLTLVPSLQNSEEVLVSVDVSIVRDSSDVSSGIVVFHRSRRKHGARRL
jgi:hypothetical protein